MRLDQDIAQRFARTALGHVTREYPNKLDHVMAGPDDVRSPRELHPAFFGSYDWHSCVHSWWTLLTLRRLYPGMHEAGEIASLAGDILSTENLAAELAYAQRPEARGFERPYGWAWLLYLHLEASRHADRDWAAHLETLARHFANGWRGYLQTLAHPIRTGTHFNTAFALRLSHEWAAAHDPELAEMVQAAARQYFAADRNAQCWEPCGDEFLSPVLMEAALMRRVLDAGDFSAWLQGFLPHLDQRQPAALFIPAQVTDASDGKAAHLDGVNFSRAWCWRELGLGEDNAQTHIEASMDAIDGDYMGSHWLASFALLAMLADGKEAKS